MYEGRVMTIGNLDNMYSPAQCYQMMLEATTAYIFMFMHSDVVIHDDFWLPKVMGHFSDKQVVAVGLGGATSLGNKDLYRKPYDIRNMARGGYASNQDDAEVHGERLDGYRQVAVLDAFFMAIRVGWLRNIGGWPTKHLTHHCLDLWLACEAARHHKKIMMEGCSCVHHGGARSCSEAYAKAAWLQGGTIDSDHAIPHRWIYEKYGDTLPIII